MKTVKNFILAWPKIALKDDFVKFKLQKTLKRNKKGMDVAVQRS